MAGMEGPIFPSSVSGEVSDSDAAVGGGDYGDSESGGSAWSSGEDASGLISSEVIADSSQTSHWTDEDWTQARAGNDPNKSEVVDHTEFDDTDYEYDDLAEPISESITVDMDIAEKLVTDAGLRPFATLSGELGVACGVGWIRTNAGHTHQQLAGNRLAPVTASTAR